MANLDNFNTMATLEPDVQDLSSNYPGFLFERPNFPGDSVILQRAEWLCSMASTQILVRPEGETKSPGLASGQAIMQHLALTAQNSMLENLLNFDALLDQYELASGQKMPDDLAVSTVLRCIDAPTLYTSSSGDGHG